MHPGMHINILLIDLSTPVISSHHSLHLPHTLAFFPACANGAPEEVLRILAEAYPESKIATDRRGRTPLHFLLGNTEHPPTAAAVVLLSSTGAPQCADENGMIPLHYACA